MTSAEHLLAGSPYLVDGDDTSQTRYAKARERADSTRARAQATNTRIRSEAESILGPYLAVTRMDLVSESNRIEGIEWDPQDVRETVRRHADLIGGPEHALTETVIAEPKLYEVLGLYRAHEIADSWLAEEHVPRAAEIRALHRVILGDIRTAGAYKQFDNEISGRPDHRTTAPHEVPRVMLELADWWADSKGDPLLASTVIHAWLAHIHPFEDGNGRLARILANLELSRSGYPPLILRAQDDRGEYYSALQASDDGDILPLYELFERAIRRQSKIMARPQYVQDIINDRLLASDQQRFGLWSATLQQFSDELTSEMRYAGGDLKVQGTLSLPAFSLLSNRDADGNGWYAKAFVNGESEWLLWFGYRSDEWVDLSANGDDFPSIFLSRRDRSDGALHPYTQFFDESDLSQHVPDEIHLLPARARTVCVRRGFDTDEFRPHEAARIVAGALTSSRRPI
ncbi:Fic family protein [Microbacterium sp. SL62]|uniref:Fic family protein n=1 Tax=Microbacterium sp. SL62 TaxID=2995139 RepID=UPI0022746CDB|nr:Fic family protein [Microbacterium sp. SL62]MCY1718699.1 Fic family protein [Microbacterium sp. SL62]